VINLKRAKSGGGKCNEEGKYPGVVGVNEKRVKLPKICKLGKIQSQKS
jgi:hypothetical protein